MTRVETAKLPNKLLPRRRKSHASDSPTPSVFRTQCSLIAPPAAQSSEIKRNQYALPFPPAVESETAAERAQTPSRALIAKTQNAIKTVPMSPLSIDLLAPSNLQHLPSNIAH